MFPESRLGTRFCGGPGVASWGLPEVPWGPLETSWEFPGASRGFLRASGRPLGAWGPFGASGDFLGAPWGLTGLLGSLWKVSGSRLGACLYRARDVGMLVRVPPVGAVLGRLWGAPEAFLESIVRKKENAYPRKDFREHDFVRSLGGPLEASGGGPFGAG